MKNYDGQEMEIKVTNNGKYQVLPHGYNAHDMSVAPVFATQSEAEAYITRPMPEYVAHERELETERAPYQSQYAAILARPEFREMRRGIQELYSEAAHQSKLHGDAQRAAVRSIGQVSAIGRNIYDVRQDNADYQADEASTAWRAWGDATHKYEVAVQEAMKEAGISIALFRSPVS